MNQIKNVCAVTPQYPKFGLAFPKYIIMTSKSVVASRRIKCCKMIPQIVFITTNVIIAPQSLNICINASKIGGYNLKTICYSAPNLKICYKKQTNLFSQSQCIPTSNVAVITTNVDNKIPKM